MAIGEAEATAIIERHPQEIAQILEQFKVLMKIGEDGFLIVQAGDYYVQFMVLKGARNLIVDAVSNNYLPAKKQLGAEAGAALVGFGFESPKIDADNFTMPYVLTGGDDNFSYLAVLALAVLYDVYHVSEDAPLSFELDSA